MAGIYITHADVRRRIGNELMSQVYDDRQDGDWRDNVDAAVDEAESEFEQNYGKIYGEDTLTALRLELTSVSRATKRIILDLFVVRMGWRHPEYTRDGLWQKRRENILADLAQLRLRDVQLDKPDESEAKNEGAVVQSGDPDNTTPVKATFGDMGDF